jgi:hypothetical protein
MTKHFLNSFGINRHCLTTQFIKEIEQHLVHLIDTNHN